jgi:hypothetical protein
MERPQAIAYCSLLLLICLLMLVGCNRLKRSRETETSTLFSTGVFHQYWHAGKAEISSYNLNQSRYGESRSGKAVVIFVTEDFSKKRQVKLDDPSSGNKINVLKVNLTKNFITGIYPYSMMLSVFTPVNREDYHASLKATMSSQEWCGQVYTQLNLRGNRFAVKSHSYFELEGDQQFSVREALLEDEVWNIIRLDPESLPLGKIDVIPSLFFTRLNHTALRVQSAIAQKTETDSSFEYRLTYPEQARQISIRYEKQFPFKILGWKESWKEKNKDMETTAVLDKTLFTDYWTKNKNEFSYLRDSLGLPHNY